MIILVAYPKRRPGIFIATGHEPARFLSFTFAWSCTAISPTPHRVLDLAHLRLKMVDETSSFNTNPLPHMLSRRNFQASEDSVRIYNFIESSKFQPVNFNSLEDRSARYSRSSHTSRRMRRCLLSVFKTKSRVGLLCLPYCLKKNHNSIVLDLLQGKYTR